jgi:choline dehydrogenase-like flavoprotein
MSIEDAADVPDGTTLAADLCVVGAGPAGLAIAVELDGAPLDVLVLEAGGFDPDPDEDPIAGVEVVGLPLRDPAPRRRRGFGGTTQTWYGRLARYDDLDFEPRPWVRASGWPIRSADVFAFEPRALRFFGAPPAPFSDTRAVPDAAGRLWAEGLAPALHVWPRDTRTARLHHARLARSANVRALLHAHATRLLAAHDGGTIAGLTARGPLGRTIRVAARAWVLAGGAWENPRLLLLSRDADGVAVGNRQDCVGRYYMNHPRTEGSARLVGARRPGYPSIVRALTEHRAASGTRVHVAVRVSSERQRREELLNACAFFYPVGTPARVNAAEAWRSVVAAVRRRDVRAALARTGAAARGLPVLAAVAAARAVGRDALVDHLILVDQGEQPPDPESRITLGERRDGLGDPLPRLDWRVHPATTRSRRRLHELVAARVAASGVGRFESTLLASGEDPPYFDAAHPMGTTRMSDAPARGVVDADCRVHGVANLYVAGSSVFPTGGQSPPTLTIVCLALRLADRLRCALRSP